MSFDNNEKEFLIKSSKILTKLNTQYDFQTIIDWYNQNNYDYMDKTDLEMYIEYIRVNLLDNGNEA